MGSLPKRKRKRVMETLGRAILNSAGPLKEKPALDTEGIEEDRRQTMQFFTHTKLPPLDTPEVFGGLQTGVFEGPAYIGSLWVMQTNTKPVRRQHEAIVKQC